MASGVSMLNARNAFLYQTTQWNTDRLWRTRITMKTQKEYWEHHIRNWERSAYENESSGSFIESIANRFRGHLIHRKSSCKNMLLLRIEGLNVLEIGAGSGALMIELAKAGKTSRITGWEISSEAVKAGTEQIDTEALSNIAELQCRNIDESLGDIASFDLVYGLGILEYLEKKTLQELFNHLRNKKFFFQYHRKYFSLKNGLHLVYRTIKQIPIYNRYSETDILKMCFNAGLARDEIQLLNEKGNSFIYRL